MKLKTAEINWNNLSEVNKKVPTWLKSSPSRDELQRVAPMLFKNDVLTACVKKADLKKACEGMCQLIKIADYELAVVTITGLVEMVTMLAPLHEAFKDPHVPKPMLYEAMQASVDEVLVALSHVHETKKETLSFSLTFNNSTMSTVVTTKVPVSLDVACALDDFFNMTGQAYAHLLKSIKEKKTMECVLPVAQVNVNAGRQGKSRALAHAL